MGALYNGRCFVWFRRTRGESFDLSTIIFRLSYLIQFQKGVQIKVGHYRARFWLPATGAPNLFVYEDPSRALPAGAFFMWLGVRHASSIAAAMMKVRPRCQQHSILPFAGVTSA